MAHNRFTGTVFGILEDIGRARTASNTYARLSNMSDEALAQRGLDRSDLARHAFDLAFKR